MYEVDGVQQRVSKVTLVIHDAEVVRSLQSYLFNVTTLFDKQPKVTLEEVFPSLQQLRSAYCNTAGLPSSPEMEKLIEFVGNEFAEQEKKFNKMSEQGVVTFEMLRFLFPRGTKVIGMVDQKYRVGTEVQTSEYVKLQCGTVFVVRGEVIKSKGDGFFSETHSFVIGGFSGVRPVRSLPVTVMTDEDHAYLTKRGEWYQNYTIGSHFLQYEGPMMFKTRQYKTLWNASGRIMIDCSSFLMSNPGYPDFVEGRGSFGNEDSVTNTIEPTQLFKCWHSVGGFSFRTKKWGEIFVEGASDIKFDDNAYNQLVLPRRKKDLIRALVTNSNDSFSDIIAGKGNGCIFLLHGPPGTGKTLTAEAVAELLHQPLYSVTCGELGVSTEVLETKLRELLDVASIWNAVVLIDEADIFLEQRVDSDIRRNAMVGIFLRLLEYHQGIMFLTTNRVRTFDEAFHSRISVALRYPDLNAKARRQVWENLLAAAGIAKEDGEGVRLHCADLDVEALVAHDLNGRQIRTTIRLAIALACSTSESLKMDHFTQNIRVAEQFSSDLRSSFEDI